MRRQVIATVLGALLGGPALAQPSAPPEVLPPTVLDPVHTKPLTPTEALKQREADIAGLKEELITFDPNSVIARQVDGHWHVRTAEVLLKDFGSDRTSAIAAASLIQGLRVTQMGRVSGSTPAFEYWLVDGKPPRVANGRAIIMPIMSRALRAERVGGTWVVTDGAKGLYDFGNDREAACRAAIVCWKYGFNQLGVIGEGRPTMFVPLTEPRQADRERSMPVITASAVGVLNDVAKTSLLLPGDIYAGPKKPIDAYKLEVKRQERGGNSVLMFGDTVLAKFGGDQVAARAALRALQDGNATEMAVIGSTGVPLFLVNGTAMHGEPLGASKMAFRADRLKTLKVRETWWVAEDSRPLIEAGTKSDAELLIQVCRHFDLRLICNFGRPETGGLRLLTTGR
jgi:hypothetical protein